MILKVVLTLLIAVVLVAGCLQIYQPGNSSIPTNNGSNSRTVAAPLPSSPANTLPQNTGSGSGSLKTIQEQFPGAGGICFSADFPAYSVFDFALRTSTDEKLDNLINAYVKPKPQQVTVKGVDGVPQAVVCYTAKYGSGNGISVIGIKYAVCESKTACGAHPQVVSAFTPEGTRSINWDGSTLYFEPKPPGQATYNSFASKGVFCTSQDFGSLISIDSITLVNSNELDLPLLTMTSTPINNISFTYSTKDGAYTDRPLQSTITSLQPSKRSNAKLSGFSFPLSDPQQIILTMHFQWESAPSSSSISCLLN